MTTFPARTSKEIGAAIARMRHDHGWSQQVLADRAAVSRRLVGELEGGHPRAELAKVQRVVHALGFTFLLVPRDESDADCGTDLAGVPLW